MGMLPYAVRIVSKLSQMGWLKQVWHMRSWLRQAIPDIPAGMLPVVCMRFILRGQSRAACWFGYRPARARR